jgi:hypothetical protein
MSLKMVTCSRWDSTVVVWMLAFPFGLLLSVDDGLDGRSVRLCQGICGLIAQYTAVEVDPLWDDRMAFA